MSMRKNTSTSTSAVNINESFIAGPHAKRRTNAKLTDRRRFEGSEALADVLGGGSVERFVRRFLLHAGMVSTTPPSENCTTTDGHRARPDLQARRTSSAVPQPNSADEHYSAQYCNHADQCHSLKTHRATHHRPPRCKARMKVAVLVVVAGADVFRNVNG